MNTSKSLLLGIAFVAALSSCKKDDDNNVVNNNIKIRQNTRDLNIPSGFNFETTENINLNMTIGSQSPIPGKYLLKIYKENPSSDKSPVYQAFIDENNSLTEQIQVPAAYEKLYAVLASPDGSSFLTILPRSKSVSHTFYSGKRSMKTSVVSSPDCNFGCDVSRTHSGNWTADKDPSKGTVYCVTGNYNGSGSITVKDESVVRLCGSGTIPNITVNKGVVEILNGANVTVNNFNLNSNGKNDLIIYDGGSLTITNNFSPNADVTNHGDFTVNSLNLNSNSGLVNNGTMTISSNNAANFNADVENYGTMTVNGTANINGGTDFENYCGLYLNSDLQLNGDIENYSYVSIAGQTVINGGGKFKMEDGAMAETDDLMLNGKIEGDGSTSFFKVADQAVANGGAQIKDAIQFCEETGSNVASSVLRSGATFGCSLVIPTDACNPVGNGQPQIADADNDGVADNIDAYPNDASRAADSYYPDQNNFGTVAFEDLWPAYGDYDFNDLVVDYQYHQVLNASNEVVHLNATFATKAIGGALKNGFGFQLDIASGDVNQVTGTRSFGSIVTNNANGTESGQNLATIIVYDDATQALPNTTGAAFVNTVNGNPHVEPDTAIISISFVAPQTIAALGSAPYNPFIFINQTRGREVHLAGNAPTDLADNAFFGTLDDNTNPNNTANAYKSESNLPWAIDVVDGFSYPEEKTDISEAYQYFSIWAQSGGASYTNWYDDQPGYIAEDKIYVEQ